MEQRRFGPSRTDNGSSRGAASDARSTQSPGDAHTVRYAVLGSSLGSLCIYGACLYGWTVRGIELLPLLVRHAERVVQGANVRGVSFECADILSCDLQSEQVLLLASQVRLPLLSVCASATTWGPFDCARSTAFATWL